MKNLKRLLSLALTGVMLSGMMVMGASAANFGDADEIVNVEAVDTMVALNIINGKPDGNYDPNGLVTRAEMAKMIATAVNGGVAPEFGTKPTPTYSDIKGNWAEQYIEYCYDMKYISGRGNGTFDPAGNVTGVEAAKMVLTALGYDETAYQLKGADWAINTNAIAIRTCKPSLYENLNGVNMNVAITRDTAAQIIWNGVQNHVVEWTPNREVTGTGLNYQYTISETVTLLNRAYDAYIWVGSFNGNDKFGLSGLSKGEIEVEGRIEGAVKADGTPADTQKAHFPAEYDIANIGEETKVIFKDGKGGTKGQPDRNDTIYGVFNTGVSNVLNVTKNDITARANFNKAGKIKVSGTEYDVLAATATAVPTVVIDFGVSTKDVATTGADYTNREDAFQALATSQSPDAVKFIFDGDNKIAKAYVTTYKLARVTGVSSTKITLSTDGAVDIKDNDIYDDIAKDDVVVVNRFYNGSDKEKALFVVKKAETVEGKVDGYKGTENVVVDGTTYKIVNKAATLADVSDDKIVNFGTSGSNVAKIGDTVRLYMINGMVAAAQSLETSDKSWAVITDMDWADSNLASTISPNRVTVLYGDGTSETLAVHKDSTADGTKAPVGNSTIAIGALAQYTMSGGKIKFTKIIMNAGDANGAGLAAGTTIYDKEKKTLKFQNGTSSSITKYAAADAKIFVVKDKVNASDALGTIEASDDFTAYDLRDLGNISVPNPIPSGAKFKVVASLNDKDQVEAAVVILTDKPTGNTSTTVYGIVNDSLGTRKINDTEYNYYVVSSGDEMIDVYIPTTESLAKGDIVTFDQTNDNCYDAKQVNKLDGQYIAVDSYNADKLLLTYYTWTAANNVGIYEGHGGARPLNITVDKDAKIIYVDTDKNVSSEGYSITGFDATTGKANALIKVNGTSNLVDVIIVETSGEGFGSTPGFTKTTIVAPSAADKKLTVDEVKAAGEGVVFPSSDAVKPTTGFGGNYGDFTKLVFFNFTSKAAGDYTMTIKKGSQVVYTEDLDGLAANTKYVLHVDTLANDGSDSGNTCTWSNGGLKTAGTYTFEIVQDTGSVVVLKGTFQK